MGKKIANWEFQSKRGLYSTNFQQVRQLGTLLWCLSASCIKISSQKLEKIMLRNWLHQGSSTTNKRDFQLSTIKILRLQRNLDKKHKGDGAQEPQSNAQVTIRRVETLNWILVQGGRNIKGGFFFLLNPRGRSTIFSIQVQKDFAFFFSIFSYLPLIDLKPCLVLILIWIWIL